MNQGFQNKTVLITGASSGIGKALTESMLQAGAKVAICARNAANLSDVKQALKSDKLLTIQADVSIEADCKRFVEEAMKTFGHIDILINNAGISMRALLRIWT
ncbi:11-beta-hydroxysteroid dehydrogenase-like 3 [Filimonas sp.]|nr:11-beta-hydroxysteroid dehydrogenase-like 3 [Filimonas sp.]